MYGSQLARVYGESVPSVWARTIAGMDQYKLATGLRNLVNNGSGTVPSLPQFVKACHQTSHEGMERNHSPEKTITKEYHAIHAHAQKCLFAYLWNRDAASQSALDEMIAIKNKIVSDMIAISKEEEITGTEIRKSLFARWDNLWKPMPSEQMQRHHESFAMTGFAANLGG